MSTKTNKIDSDVAKYMKSVRKFLRSKNGGVIAPEWAASLVMLEEYYRTFLQMSEEISQLDSFTLDNKYSKVLHPLLRARDAASARIESLLKSLGCTFKESLKLDLTEPVTNESPLEQFMNNKIEKR